MAETPPPPFVSVVIPTYQRPDMLRTCLQGVQRALHGTPEGAVEVIVSDDSRDDHTHRLVELEFPWVTYVAGPRRGPACNRNCGAALARGSWLVFTDDDCIPDQTWLSAYLHAFECSPQQALFEGRTRADRARSSNLEESPVNDTGGYLWSCNMALARSLFRELGGFCESFPYPAMEDVDMRLRLEQRGHRPSFVPAASVCHPYRPIRGAGFIRQHNASYRHLLERHPALWQSLTWGGIALEAARLLKAAAKNTLRHGPAGMGTQLYAVATKVLIDIGCKLRKTPLPPTRAA